LRWDDAAIKLFSENAPYYIAGGRVANVEGRTIEIEAIEVDEAEVLRQGELLVRKVATSLRAAAENVLAEYIAAPATALPDPMPYLLSNNFLVLTGRGRFIYTGPMLQLMEALDRFLSNYAAQIGAEPHAYPTTVGTKTLLQSGYLKAFPQHALFVAPAAFSASSLTTIGQCSSAGDLDAPYDERIFANHDEILAPTVCYHTMEAMQGRNLDTSRCFSAVNACHRFETLANNSLDRLQTFRMREIIQFGNQDEVMATLDSALSWTAAILTRWGITHRITTATDPFFAGAVGNKLYFQSMFALKRELRLRLDFSNHWLSVASFNNHQQSLTRAFDIHNRNGALFSGCVGWGYERLVYALLSQLGTNFDQWPSLVRGDLGL
jgi:seryl-tRNA synthetase